MSARPEASQAASPTFPTRATLAHPSGTTRLRSRCQTWSRTPAVIARRHRGAVHAGWHPLEGIPFQLRPAAIVGYIQATRNGADR